ncbi:MAG: HPr kinase/phosphatase C-terminal domain-containing protein [Roseomonas sp.]|nr:HPr kinase/phosphatase C-terminal domain-containing protein [Roseomonas sp.]
MLIHASAAAWGSEAVLFRGPSGAGKSDLVLRLIGRGWHLVADDQVMLEGETLSAPPALRGMLEIRGLGIFTALPVVENARLRLVVDLAARADVPQLPEPAFWQGPASAVPRITLHALEDSACDKVIYALGAATGRLHQKAGAFAA